MKLIPKTVYFPSKLLEKLEKEAATDRRRFSNHIIFKLEKGKK